MSEVIEFKPLAQVSVERNIQAFVDYCKNELDLWSCEGFDWDAIRWDITGHTERRGRSNNKYAIIWSNLESVNNRKHNSYVQMKEPFCSFAKAYVRYIQSINGPSLVEPTITMLKIVEHMIVLRKNESHIQYLNNEILDETSNYIIEKYKVAHRYLQPLEKLYQFCCEKMFVQTTLPWIAPKVKCKKRYSIDEQSIKESKDKCPSDACLRALAKIFVESKDPVDVMGTSIAVIMLSNSCRIGEVLTLPYDCEAHDWHGAGSYGLRWFPEKGGPLTVKKIHPDWVDIVKEAILNIKNLTNEARLMAKWYEDNPSKMYLPAEYKEFHDVQYLKCKDVRAICSLYDDAGFKNAVKPIYSDYKTTGIKLLGNEKVVLKSDLDQFIRSKLHVLFPFIRKDLKYSDSLFVVPLTFFDKTSRCFSKNMFDAVHYHNIQHLYGYKINSSIFDRNNLTEDDGQRIIFRTHSARHWQNNLLNLNHVPAIFIALMSGRKNLHQNNAYNHVTDKERFDQLNNAVYQTLTCEIDRNQIHDISENDRLTIIKNELSKFVGTAHVTETGFCLHDIASLPCPKVFDCIACSDHLYLKGDPRNELVRVVLREEKALLEMVKERQKREELYGADLWCTSKSQHIAKLQNIVDVFDNNDVPKGTFMRLAVDNEFNPVKLSLYKKTGRAISGKNSVQLELIQTKDLI